MNNQPPAGSLESQTNQLVPRVANIVTQRIPLTLEP